MSRPSGMTAGRRIFLAAHVCVVAFAAFAAAVIGALYPLRYERQAAAAAREFGLSPALVLAVAATESRLDAAAVSRAGARGLMQLMPDTFAFAKTQVAGLTDIDDPCANLRAGCWYLSYLLARFPLPDALAAYNAGEGRVRAWLDAGLDEYPFPETRAYVVKVLRAERAYAFRLRGR